MMLKKANNVTSGDSDVTVSHCRVLPCKFNCMIQEPLAIQARESKRQPTRFMANLEILRYGI